MSKSMKMTARIVIVALVMGVWLYIFRDTSHAEVRTQTTVAVKNPVDGCHIPWAVANGGYNIKDWCRKHGTQPRMDPKLKFIYKCGGAAVIATWFVRRARVGAAMGALSACAWGSLFDGHPVAKRQAVHHALAVRSRGCPSARGMRAV